MAQYNVRAESYQAHGLCLGTAVLDFLVEQCQGGLRNHKNGVSIGQAYVVRILRVGLILWRQGSVGVIRLVNEGYIAL